MATSKWGCLTAYILFYRKNVAELCDKSISVSVDEIADSDNKKSEK